MDDIDRQIEYAKSLKTNAYLAVEQNQPIIDPAGSQAFIPITVKDNNTIIVILSGGNPAIYNNPPAWFTNQIKRAEQELTLIKQWAIDPASGLLNATHFFGDLKQYNHNPMRLQTSLIEDKQPDDIPHILLIEAYPRGNNANQALINIRETGFYLASLLADSAPLHHLGCGIFALIWPKSNDQEIQKLGYAILRKLKGQNIASSHIGIAPLRTEEASASKAEDSMAKAWQALQTSRKRGIFALCTSTALNPKNQHLPPLEADILAKLQKKWRRENQFSIILLKRDLATTSPTSRLLTLIGEQNTVIQADRELFIFMPGVDSEEALKRAEDLRKKIEKLACGTYSQGIASYPCPGFKKADIPLNARKAIRHASFYGQAAITSFNAVSLNISGDVFYNEGDLNNAIREYRLGLNLDPANTNLLNSLGVIYAQIERYKKAIPLFERILAIKSDDFMAMYNLGFAYLRGGNPKQAQTYFEQAVSLNENSFDLLLQLGQIYCAERQYKKAVNILNKAQKAVSSPKTAKDIQPWEHCEPWQDSCQNLGHELIYRYLGEAYKGIKKNRDAITYLQRATRYNSRDAKALSLLGELYSLEKQGSEIAVSLCRQAVELEDKSAGHWRRLAFVLLADKLPQEALTAIKKSLRLVAKDQNSLLLLARIHQDLGSPAKARNTLEKILKFDGTNKKAAKLLKQINRKQPKV